MALWDLALAAFAPRAAWSFMANGVNYLVIGAAVAFEYLFRRWRFRDYDHPGLRRVPEDRGAAPIRAGCAGR